MRIRSYVPAPHRISGFRLGDVVEPPMPARRGMSTAETVGIVGGLALAIAGSALQSSIMIGIGSSFTASAIFSALARNNGWHDLEEEPAP
ncbi:MAG: hypothetical protein A3E78_13370 [Alphaproteobacteria bacterium RIFCSPHIGHO2_12_FULL_63_12]|nr:MAG: hypothetical protein A3E78_13370 [Alphaproteobacteria bacterium RIFCSPHIGHO2_12_FULL_63_12]